MSQLKKSSIRLVPYGTHKILEVLGMADCLIEAEAGAITIMSVYVIKGAEESLLGLRDTQALGILRINPDGNLARTSINPLPGAETGSKQTQPQQRDTLLGSGEGPQSDRQAVTTSMEEQSSSWDPKSKCGTCLRQIRDVPLGLGEGPQLGRNMVTTSREEWPSSWDPKTKYETCL